MRLPKYQRIGMPKSWGIRLLRYQGIRMPKYWGIQGYPKVEEKGCPYRGK